MLKFIRSQKGFTLIELLVVIGILAALAGVVTLAVSQFIGEGECQACITDRHNVQTAVVAYMAQNQGVVPTSPADSGDIDVYLLDSPKYNWSWDCEGVINVDCIDFGVDCS
ncbi:MAG: type II secretion system protein [Chloroflexota bacterium]|nr:MAG: type II secretion system protein [Chloroflexota bacterium]